MKPNHGLSALRNRLLAGGAAAFLLAVGLTGCGSTSTAGAGDAPSNATQEAVSLDPRYTEAVRDVFLDACVTGDIMNMDDPIAYCEQSFECVARALPFDDYEAYDSGKTLKGADGRRVIAVMKRCAEEAVAAQ